MGFKTYLGRDFTTEFISFYIESNGTSYLQNGYLSF